MTVQSAVEELLKGAESEEEKLKRLFTFVRDEIRFDFVYPQDVPVETVLREGRGVCMQKANLLVALAREAGFKARFRFMYVSKKALEDFLPDFAYTRWVDPFPHTFPEIFFRGQWISMEATFDPELHRVCLAKGINFARYPVRDRVSIEFSTEGVIGHQQFFQVKDRPSFVGDDLSPLLSWNQAHIPWYKRLLQPMIFRKASAILGKLRREGVG
jgi:transglutaminase-like putative cysteine protease